MSPSCNDFHHAEKIGPNSELYDLWHVERRTAVQILRQVWMDWYRLTVGARLQPARAYFCFSLFISLITYLSPRSCTAATKMLHNKKRRCVINYKLIYSLLTAHTYLIIPEGHTHTHTHQPPADHHRSKSRDGASSCKENLLGSDYPPSDPQDLLICLITWDWMQSNLSPLELPPSPVYFTLTYLRQVGQILQFQNCNFRLLSLPCQPCLSDTSRKLHIV